MALLAIRLIEPTGAGRCADVVHRAVAALALHCGGAIGRHCTAHCTAEAAGGGSGMAGVARRTIGDVVEREMVDGADHLRVLSVHGLGQRRSAGRARSAESLGGMTFGAKNRGGGQGHRRVEAVGAEAIRREGGLKNRVIEMVFIMQSQNIEPVIAGCDRVVHPSRSGFCRRP